MPVTTQYLSRPGRAFWVVHMQLISMRVKFMLTSMVHLYLLEFMRRGERGHMQALVHELKDQVLKLTRELEVKHQLWQRAQQM